MCWKHLVPMGPLGCSPSTSQSRPSIGFSVHQTAPSESGAGGSVTHHHSLISGDQVFKIFLDVFPQSSLPAVTCSVTRKRAVAAVGSGSASCRLACCRRLWAGRAGGSRASGKSPAACIPAPGFAKLQNNLLILRLSGRCKSSRSRSERRPEAGARVEMDCDPRSEGRPIRSRHSTRKRLRINSGSRAGAYRPLFTCVRSCHLAQPFFILWRRRKKPLWMASSVGGLRLL